ncbi:hypothetical protein C8R47DRAFT_1070709 [Mycena vitilis]|nr:hypothetical protein C8R47DRAFT_1070709 [Mycena vitilis]
MQARVAVLLTKTTIFPLALPCPPSALTAPKPATSHLWLAATKACPSTTRASRASSPDCQHTNQSPRLPSGLLDDSDDGSPPPLCDILSSAGDAQGESEPAALPRNPAININKAEVDGYLTRIGRAPPSPSHHTWTTNSDWISRRDSFLRNLESAETADVRAMVRQLELVLERTPGIVDRQRMKANEHVDMDFVNQLQHPAVTSAGCREIAERAQRAQATRDTYSPGSVDIRPIYNITHIPVSQDGKRLRQLTKRAIDQPLMYRYAIERIVQQHLDWIQPYSELRRKGLALLYYLDDLSKRRRGTVDQTLLHQRCPIPPPYLHPHEYARLRILKYTFERDGNHEVGRVLDGLLRYRFKESEVVSHLLYSGLFDPKDVLLADDGSFRDVASRVVPAR